MSSLTTLTVRPRFVRPQHLVPAALALALAIPLTAADRTTRLAILALPALLLAARFYELARFEAVHRSGFLLLLTGWNALSASLLAADKLVGAALWGAIAAAALLLVLAGYLFAVQRRLHDARQDGADWAFGGFLAWFGAGSVFLVLAPLVEGPAARTLALAAAAAVLLWLQVRRHPWFPRLAATFAVAAPLLELASGRIAEDVRLQVGVLAALSACVEVVYLLRAPRVRRTFAPAADRPA
jgi:hypothetical protein